MNSSYIKAPQPVYYQGLRLESGCDLASVRKAAHFARAWLAAQQVDEAELGAWELVLVEAGNNAVKYALETARALPVVFDLSIAENNIEARITDHTAGFDFPDQVDLPDRESESGRGLFLIKSLTDQALYFKGGSQNQLVLWKRRTATAISGAPTVFE